MKPEERALTQSIGERIRQTRHERGLSLQKLADLTDGMLSKSRISNYEQGIRRPSIEVAQILAKALGGVSAAYLLGVDGLERKMSPDEMRLVKAYRSADKRGKRTILATAEMEFGKR
jgi:transcriptional regulator with XRE-family HTH domain